VSEEDVSQYEEGNQTAVSTSSIVPRESRPLDAFLAEVRASPTITRGRLIFALDATGSRQPTWDTAASLQAEMFREAAAIGSLDLQLVYYRGDECKASGWLANAQTLDRLMCKIACVSGMTQIEKVLAHAAKEASQSKVGALVFVGDAVEESVDVLVTQARELGRFKTPAFMFQEGADSTVQSAFRDIAASTGGAYGRFDAGGVKQLGELLRAVAAFAVGGVQALKGRKDRESVLLLEQMQRKP
jgi:hypothetical protein